MATQLIQGYRLSPQQNHLWLLQDHSATYRTQCRVLIQGEVQTATLLKAIEQVVQRHEILQTVFCARSGIKVPLQVPCDGPALSCREIDLTPAVREVQPIHEEQVTFDLANGPLVHADLTKQSSTVHQLTVAVPALCADTESLRNLIEEVSRRYDALHGDFAPEADEVVQYSKFSPWQNDLLED